MACFLAGPACGEVARLLGRSDYGLDAKLDVCFRGAQFETLMRMPVRPCHMVPPHQQVPSAWSRPITARVTWASSPTNARSSGAP